MMDQQAVVDQVNSYRYLFIQGQLETLADAFMMTAESYATAMQRAAAYFPYPWEVETFIREVLTDAN